MTHQRARAIIIATAAAATAALSIPACGDDFEARKPKPDSGVDGSAGSDASASGGVAGEGGGGATAGSGGAAAGSGGSAGSGGTAGAGGSTTWSCVPIQGAFPIVTPSDIGATDELGENLVLVPQGNGVHVGVDVVQNGTNGALLVRTVSDNGMVSPAAIWASGVTVGGGFLQGTSISSEISFFGSVSLLKKVTFLTGAQGVTSASPVSTDLPSPPLCTELGGYVRNKVFSFASPSDYRVAVTCENAGQRKLYVGGSSVAFEEVDSGTEQDSSLIVEQYVYSGNRHLIQNNDGIYRFGVDAASLATPHQLVLTTEANLATVGFNLFPLESPAEGSVVLAATIEQTALVPAELFVGALTTSQYTDLATPQPASLKSFASLDAITNVPKLGGFVSGELGDTIVVAAFNVPQDRLLFTIFDRNGSVLLFNHEIYKAPTGTTIVGSHAAHLGFYELAVWLEETSGSRKLMGQRLQCSKS